MECSNLLPYRGVRGNGCGGVKWHPGSELCNDDANQGGDHEDVRGEIEQVYDQHKLLIGYYGRSGRIWLHEIGAERSTRAFQGPASDIGWRLPSELIG